MFMVGVDYKVQDGCLLLLYHRQVKLCYIHTFGVVYTDNTMLTYSRFRHCIYVLTSSVLHAGKQSFRIMIKPRLICKLLVDGCNNGQITISSILTTGSSFLMVFLCMNMVQSSHHNLEL